MSKSNLSINRLTAGEFSPRMEGRTDVQEYFQASSQLSNFIPIKQGGATKRVGTRFVLEVTDLGSDVEGGAALIPFIFSKTEAYAIAIKNNGAIPASASPFIKVYRNDGVELPISPFSILQSPAIPATLDPRGYVYAQSGDVMFVTHSSGTVEPFLIVRGNVAFIVTDISNLVGFPAEKNPTFSPAVRNPYRDPNTTATTLTPDVLTGAVTVTASTGIFNINHIRSIWKIKHGAVEGIFRITGFTSSTVVTGVTLIDFGAITATDNWQESSWSGFRGYPRTVAIFQQRVIWGGNISQPDTIWASLQGNFFHMMERRLAQDVAASSDVSGLGYFIDAAVPDAQQDFEFDGRTQLSTDPFQFTIASQEVNEITWLSSGRSLHIGTLGAEYIASGGDESLSRRAISLRQQTDYGGSPVRPVRVNNEVMYITRSGKGFRNFKFNETNGSYVSIDLTIHADHMVRHGEDDVRDVIDPDSGQFKQMSFQAGKDIVWLLNDKNSLVGFTYSPTFNVVGFHRHTIGGTGVNVWGVASIPNVKGTFDEVWLLVGRQIDGVTLYSLEKMVDDFNADSIDNTSPLEENIPMFADSSVVRSIVASNLLINLDHLEGEVVQVTKDGKFVSEFTVAGNQIDLGSNQTGRFVIGLQYVATLDTMPVEAGGEFGTALGSTKRVDKVTALLYKSLDCKIGSTFQPGDLEAVKFENDDIEDKKAQIHPQLNPGKTIKVRIQSDLPLPLTVLSLALRGDTND